MGMWYCATCHKEGDFTERVFRSEKGLVICKECKVRELKKGLNKIARKQNKK